MPPVKLFWYDGLTANPEIPGVPKGEYLGDLPTRTVRRAERNAAAPPPPPSGFVGHVFNYADFDLVRKDPNPNVPKPDGSLFIGDKGMLTTGTYGENTRLIPVDKMQDYEFPKQLLTRSPGHHQDWIRAAKGGDPSCSNFNIAAPFVEWMLLGVIALRVEGKIEYDAATMKITNNADANKYLKPTFHKGWQFV
jgi:hypothetical protein